MFKADYASNITD